MDLNSGEVSLFGNLSSMSGTDGRRTDFYEYQDSEAASTDYVEGDVSGYAYQQKGPIVESVPGVAKGQQPHIHSSVPLMNPYLAINHGIEDFKHQNTEGRRTLHKGIYSV